MTTKKTITTLLSGALSVSSILAQDTASIPNSPAAANQQLDDMRIEAADLALVGTAQSQPAIGDGGLVIEDANINDVFQLLAKSANKQYFHNNKLNAEEYKVTGHLNAGAGALKQMEELAFQYGLRMYEKGNTLYAMLDDQLQNLPAKEWTYSLNYLRPTDIEQIRLLITPMLSPGRGIVNYEPKTNTVIVIDTMRHIEMVESLLKKIDQPKGQIAIEVKILRVNRSAGKQRGVDWSTSLGENGVPVNVARSLSSIFGLSGEFVGSTFENASSNLILSPFEINGVLRALNDTNLVTQQSNPIVITEDNENASISLVDRVPIITTTTTTGTASTDAEEVRYKIDESDSTDPESTREIGLTVFMTPSLLPDGTIRMKMRPRNAEIVDEIRSASGNVYPQVNEATIETIARIPDGHSLVIGGFYSEREDNIDNDVPLLGRLPIFNFFFNSESKRKSQSSLVFVVTPTSYDPSNVSRSNRMSNHVKGHLDVDSSYDTNYDKNYNTGGQKGSTHVHGDNQKPKLKGLRKFFLRR